MKYADWLWTIGKDGITLVSYLGNKLDIVVPSEIDGIPVVSIGGYCFAKMGADGKLMNNLKVISVKLPHTLRRIDKKAFYGCRRLIRVKCSEGLEEIGDKAFYDCLALRFFRFPKSLKWIGNEAFFRCKKYKAKIGNGTISVGENAFSTPAV